MTHADLSDIDFEKSRRGGRGSAGLVVTALAWGSMLALLAFVVPKFETIFKDFGVDLGRMTSLSIHASHLLVDYLYVFAPLALVVVGLDAWHRDALQRRKGDPRPGLAWSLATLGFPLAVVVGSILGLGWSLIILQLRLRG